MLYYQLDLVRRRDPEFCFLRRPPEGLELEKWKLAQGERIGDAYPADAVIRMTDTESGIQVPDVVSNNQLLVIVSAAVGRVIEELNRGEAEYLPVRILNHKGRVASEGHVIVNPIGTVDCLDLEQSEIETFEGEIVGLDRIVLDPAKLEDAPDLFRLEQDPAFYVISERVVDALIDLDPEPRNVVIHELEQAE